MGKRWKLAAGPGQLSQPGWGPGGSKTGFGATLVEVLGIKRRWVLGVVFLAACTSGTVTVEKSATPDAPPSSSDSGPDLPAGQDVGQRDSLVRDDGQPAADKTTHDLISPDTNGPTNPPGVGDPCPPECPNGLLCINNVCRAPCQAPQDPCGAVSNCPGDHRCAPLANQSGTYVCMPASYQPGDVCDMAQGYCPDSHVCAWVGDPANPPPSQCLPVCAAEGSACGTGGAGVCYRTESGCLFCSAP